MKRWILSLIVNTVALMVVAGYFDGFRIANIQAAFIASFILSVFHIFVKPILVLLTLPVTLFTLGLFLFVINAILLTLTADIMGPSFEIDGFGMALIASVILSLLNMFLQKIIVSPLIKKDKRQR